MTISSSPSSWPSLTPVEDLGHGSPRQGARSDAGERSPDGGTEQLRRRGLATRAPVALPGEALGVARLQDTGRHARIEPAVRLPGPSGVHGEAWRQGVPGRLGGAAQHVERRPGPLGVDVVGGDRRDATPVVDAGPQQRPQVVGQVGRGLDVDLGREEEPGDGDRPAQLVRGARRVGVHGRARLGQEVLDDHLLDVAVAAVRGGDGLQRVEPVLPALADADEDPGGERDGQASGRLQGGEPPRRRLVGGAAVGVESSASVSSIMPWLAATGRSAGQLVLERAPALAWGRRPVSSSTSRHIAAR